MLMQKCLSIALAIPLLAVVLVQQLTAQEKPSEDLTKWTDKQLRQAIESSQLGSEVEAQLSEVVRRGGDDWKKLLKDKNAAFTEGKAFPNELEQRRFWPRCDLDLLTAMRRLNGQPDPLQVLIIGKHQRSYSLHNQLDFNAVVVNLDTEKATIHGLTNGGNYRSGRLERWRFEIRNENGDLLPCIEQFGLMGGGISTFQNLAYGESWQVNLPLRNYVQLSKPGKYKLRLHYHNHSEIARNETIAGLLTAHSDEIELEITPIRVSATDQERAEARQWIAKLPEEGPVKILMGGVIASPKQLPPDSPAGRLQRMHKDAIPDLIDAALDGELTPGKRAWVLALLTGITGHNNPCDEFFSGGSILGAYEYSSAHSRRSGSGKIDPIKQKAFAEQWRVWKTDGYFTMEKPTGE